MGKKIMENQFKFTIRWCDKNIRTINRKTDAKNN